jgi:hypothetical protein
LLRKLNHVVVLIITVVSRCWTWFNVNIVCRNLVWCAKFDPDYRGSTHHYCQRPVTSLEPATQHMAGAALTLPRPPLVDPLPETHCCRSECTAQQSLSQIHGQRPVSGDPIARSRPAPLPFADRNPAAPTPQDHCCA